MKEYSLGPFQDLIKLILPALIFLGTIFCGYVLRKFIFVKLSRWAKKSSTKIDDVILSAIKGPLIFWFLMLGLYFAMGSSQLPEGLVQTANKILLALALFSITLVLANITGRLIYIYSGRIEAAMPVSSLTQNITRIVIFGVGILIILNSLGISITPILATLGVGGLAVALALQDTLSNLFSGFHMSLAKQIRIGDYIKLETGEEGYVIDIDWRATKIRMLPNNVILIPNAKLSQAIVTNYYLPEKEMAVLVQVGVHYDSDLKKVEKVTCEVAKETMQEVNGGVAGFRPFIRYHTFADFSINFTVILRAREFVDQYLVKHEFIKRLHERYAKEGINIPYPIRAINYAQEKAK